jgi:hypothetical protein
MPAAQTTTLCSTSTSAEISAVPVFRFIRTTIVLVMATHRLPEIVPACGLATKITLIQSRTVPTGQLPHHAETLFAGVFASAIIRRMSG